MLADVLLERARDGAAVLFSSHQLELVERLCDEVSIIADGRLVASGRGRGAAQERLAPSGSCASRWTGRATGTARSTGVAVADEDGHGVVLRLDDAVDDQSVLEAARAAGPVRQFSPVQPSLAELFREVVSR